MSLEALMRQAEAAVNAGDLTGAEPLLRQIVSLNPRDADAWHMLAIAAIRSGRSPEAIEFATRAHQLARHNHLYLNTLGVAHGETGDLEGAVRWLRRALRERANHAESHYNLGKAYAKLGQWEDAERSYLRARHIDPARLDVANNLGVLYCKLGRFGEALPLFRQAFAASPHNEDLAINIGRALHAVEGPAAASAFLQDFAGRHPNSPELRAILSTELLTQGRYAEGWRESVWRHRAPHSPRFPGTVQALPDRLEGETVLLVPDGGLGDHLFYLRFASVLRQRGARSVLLCVRPLLGLLRNTSAVDQVVAADAPLPEQFASGHRAVLGDLPRLLDVATTLPPVVLQAEEDRRVHMRERLAALGPPPYIGVTWRGGLSQEHRSEFGAKRVDPLFKQIDSGELGQILSRLEGTVVIVQRNPSAPELSAFQHGLARPAYDFSALNESLQDMAALLCCLHAYVGVSNTNMHIHAGLGRAAHVLVPFPPEFRWGHEGEESPWYPGFSVYRQTSGFGWGPALAQLAVDLTKSLKAKGL